MDEADSRKELASRLADVLGKSDALSLIQLLCNRKSPDTWDWRSASGALGPFRAFADLGLMSFRRTDRKSVGIWEEEVGTGDFVRAPAHMDLWRFCADVERIPRKSGRKRIAFLGESVARGYFYDPFYSPARVLEQIILSAGCPVEVVDLAQSNSDEWWLSTIADSTEFLEPDAIVVFAGNNWRAIPFANLPADEFAVDGSLLAQEGGLAKMILRQREKLDVVAETTVAELARAAERCGAPLIIVIPELNLAHWSNCLGGALDAPLMSSDDTVDWVSAIGRASESLRTGAYEDAERFAREAVSYDRGVSSSSLELLARIHCARGNQEAALSALRSSRDRALCFLDGARSLPGIYSNVAETIRRVGVKLGAEIVDLPAIFKSLCGDLIPGRRLFLDYCHLTSEGIRIAMAATASELLPKLSAPRSEFTELFERAPSPSAEQEGWAHLLAGIHNAHWGQPAEFCDYQLERAISCHPILKDAVMPLVYDAFRRATPSLLLSAFDEIVRNETAAAYLLGYGTIFRTIGVVGESRLLSSILSTCPSLAAESADPDFSLGTLAELDLLHPHWSELTDANRWYSRGYTAVYGLESKYAFVSSISNTLNISVTCRIPESMQSGRIGIELNGSEIGTAVIGRDWHSVSFMADSRHVRQGNNQLILHWPNVRREDIRQRARLHLEKGRQVDMRTHFGHLHDLRVSVRGVPGTK